MFTTGLGYGIISRRDCAHLLYHEDDEAILEVEEENPQGEIIRQSIIDVVEADEKKVHKEHMEQENQIPLLMKMNSSFPNDAKHLFWFNIVQTVSAGILICIIFIILRYYITLIYTSVPAISEVLQQLIVIYGFCCILEFSNTSLSCAMRLTEHVTRYSVFGLVYCILIQGTLSYIFCFVCDMKA